MKRVVITGASGFVGSNLTRRVLQEGHSVHLFLRHNSNMWRLDEIKDDVEIHELSIENTDAVGSLMHSIRPEWVFHLATHGAYSWQTDVHKMIATNITGTVNLLEAAVASGCELFVNTGSSSEYGFKDHAPTEDEATLPNSYYAVTKSSATMYCQHMALVHDLSIFTLRLYSVYGPYEDPLRLMPTLIVQGLRNQLPPLVNPDIARDYIYVDDVCDAYMLLPQTEHRFGGVYNIGSGVQTTVRLAVAIACESMNISVEPVWGSMPNRQWDTNCWVADRSKSERHLGWVPKYSFCEGFGKMVQWFQQHPELTGTIYGDKLQPARN